MSETMTNKCQGGDHSVSDCLDRMVGKHPIVLDKPIFPYSHDLLLLHTRWEVISPYYIPIICTVYVHYIYTGHGSPCEGYIVTCPSRC